MKSGNELQLYLITIKPPVAKYAMGGFDMT